MRQLVLSAFGLAVIVCAFGQSANAPAFEVTTIRPASAQEVQSGSSGISTGHGRAVGENVTLKRIIYGSYNIGPNQVVGGPTWIDSDRFHFEGKAGTPANENPDLDRMIQAMLTERFHLVLHRETRTIQALVLEAGKSPKLEKGDGGVSSTDNGTGNLQVKNETIAQFAEKLSRQTGLPVVNQTGIEGVFNIKLVWTPDGKRDDRPNAPPTLYTAIQEQLGLRLESKKAPVEVLVVDRAEKPTEN